MEMVEMVHARRVLRSDPSRRSMVACNRCRHRKTKCAGHPPEPCAACVDVGESCVYSEAEKRVSITESYYRYLQSQARTSRNSDSQSAPSVSQSVPERDSPLERDDWWYKGTDNLFVNTSGEHQFVGASSTTHLAKRLNPSTLDDTHPLYEPASLRRPVDSVLPPLPPLENAKRLFWVQYDYIGTIFSLIQPAQFDKRLDFVYHNPPDFSHRESCLVICQILLVIAFGLLYSINQWSGDDGPPGFTYFRHALRFLPDIHEDLMASILHVEVLCYIAYYLQNLNRRDAAFLYIGLALRMAISLGLHQEVSHEDFSEADRNRRRRAWWSVYSLDRLLSVKSGNPITIHDEDIDMMWPTSDGTSDPWPSIVLTHYTQLSRILGRIGEEIYRKKPRSGSNLILSVQSITSDLSKWLRDAPDRLRIDFTTLDTHVNRETVSINLHFYSCINMTARPLVFYIIQRRIDAGLLGGTEDWKEGLAPNTIAVIDNCITAAKATIFIMDAAKKHNLIATYGYLDGEYIFSAALLLVMVNAAFPFNENNARTMGTALSLLRSMADRGNTYLSSRHSLLLELQAAIEPNPSTSILDHIGLPANDPATPMSTLTSVPQEAHAPVPAEVWLRPPDLPSLQDMSFQFDLDDDSALWEGALDRINIDMDTDWIQNTLRR